MLRISSEIVSPTKFLVFLFTIRKMSLLYREEIDFKLAKENPWTKGVMTILGHYLYATHSCFMLTNVSCDDIENDVLLENVTLRW